MGFFSSLGQVLSNRENFKNYEERQRDIQAQRDTLAQQKPPSQAELEKAKKEGKVLIDIIDIMDTHSEDVAESTETVTMVPQAIVPGAATLGVLFGTGKFLFLPAADQRSEIYSKFRRENWEQFHKWAEKIDSKEIPNVYGYEAMFTNKKAIEKLQKVNDAEIKSIAADALKKLNDFTSQQNVLKINKRFSRNLIATVALTGATLIGSFVGLTLWATKLQVSSSRVARWQSRKQLEDPKYFVQYTPEQVEQAKANLEAKEEDKGFFARFKKRDKASLVAVIRDNKDYKAWKKQDKDESKKVERQLSAEELEDAKKDQEVIQRVTRVINNKAEDYSENMEVAADTLIMGTPFLGAGVGAIVSKIINKIGILDKYSQNHMQKFIDGLEEWHKEDVTKAYEALKNHKKDMPGGMAKSLNFFRNIMESSNKNSIKNSKLDDLLSLGNKLYTVAVATKGGRNKAITIIGGVVTGIVGSLIGLKLQKASSRAGRYLAKRELEQDPQNFIGYTNEELAQVQNVKGEKPSVGQRLKEYITFLPRVIGEYFEYQKYVKNEAVKNKALKQELVKLDVTDEQLKEAKNMQRKMFNTFEKVDDKSQEYSESVEAAIEIAKPVVTSLGMLSIASPLIIAGIQIARGKLTVPVAVDKVTKFLGNHTNFLKGKTVNNYLGTVQKNIKYVAQNSGMQESSIGNILSALSSKKQLGKEEVIELLKNIDPNELKKMKKLLGEVKLDEKLGISSILDVLDENNSDKILDEFLDNVNLSKLFEQSKTTEGFGGIGADFLRILDENNLKQFIKTYLKNSSEEINSCGAKISGLNPIIHMLGKLDDKTISAIMPMIQEYFGKTLDAVDDKISVKGLKQLTGNLKKFAQETNDEALSTYIDEKIRKNPNGMFSIFYKAFSNCSQKQLSEIAENLETVVNNIPEAELNKMVAILKEEFLKNPIGFAEALKKPDAIKNIFITKGMGQVIAAAGVSWAGINLFATFTIESYLAKLQKEAGRLGVMNALEELNDPMYYADIEPSIMTVTPEGKSEPVKIPQNKYLH